ncbi:hypothetical protein BCTU_091 [Buchnera aphidicola (Cinara tujafilina)]|uniref:VTT domain-containing protein n=1 Tax=Buchnera aphidicola (Cinara tujafilina) TaxID=261317 RepID=F7WZ32_9GAMM|nr:DedA family protein [Buchnera aphidicola]AEH39682.1 hypothetical protein BCTU_091 [Buchnera aphidicola (Cinara tujafilina)]
MKSFLMYTTHFAINHLNIIVFIMSFLESLALIGLVLPGLVIMGSFGTLIGNGQLNFYHAWICSALGCIIGDIFSYYFGIKFRNKINNILLFQINKNLIEKIQTFLYKYNFITVFLGKFIGPTRPLIPMLSGVLKLSFYKFLIPDILACILWPIIYFSPGICTLIIFKYLTNKIKNKFYHIIIGSGIGIFILFSYMIYRYLYKNKKQDIKKILMLKLEFIFLYF